jgi:hypothetical protein
MVEVVVILDDDDDDGINTKDEVVSARKIQIIIDIKMHPQSETELLLQRIILVIVKVLLPVDNLSEI